MKTPTEYVKTKIALSRQLGVSRNTLDRFLSMPGAPQFQERKGYDVGDVAGFISRNATSAKTVAATDPAIRSLRAYELSLKCARLKFSIEKERGQYVLKSDVAGSVRAVGAGIRAIMEQKLEREYPSRLAGLQTVAGVREVMFGLVDEILTGWRELTDRWQTRDGNDLDPLPQTPADQGVKPE